MLILPNPVDSEVLTIVVLYSVAASSMVLINKIVLMSIHTPSILSSMQFAATSLFIWVLKVAGAPVDNFLCHRIKPFIIYVILFMLFIYTNMQVLDHSNVETLLVFRACTPVAVSLMEWQFLGREMPSLRSAIALIIILVGAASYTLSDAAFQLKGWQAYKWAISYFCAISAEIIYAKHLSQPEEYKSMLSPTFYANTLAIVPMLMVGSFTNEFSSLSKVIWDRSLTATVIISCILGAAISYLAWKARSLLTASSFAVVGVANKLLVLVGNYLIWNKHSSALGIGAVCLALLGAAAFQGAPLREKQK